MVANASPTNFMKTVTFKEHRPQASKSGLACVQEPPPLQEIGEGGRNLNWKGMRIASTKAKKKSGALRGEKDKLVTCGQKKLFQYPTKLMQRAGICEWHVRKENGTQTQPVRSKHP